MTEECRVARDVVVPHCWFLFLAGATLALFAVSLGCGGIVLGVARRQPTRTVPVLEDHGTSLLIRTGTPPLLGLGPSFRAPVIGSLERLRSVHLGRARARQPADPGGTDRAWTIGRVVADGTTHRAWLRDGEYGAEERFLHGLASRAPGCRMVHDGWISAWGGLLERAD